MKTLFFTLLFFCAGVVGFAQTTPASKPVDQSKNDQPLCGATLRPAPEKKATLPHTTTANRPAISVISIIPALKLWLLPANFPNPFTRTED